MSHSLSYLRRGFLGIAFVGTLGFGAAQAFATPPGLAAARACDPVQDATCRDRCQAQGADSGICDPTFAGRCRCIYY